MQASSRSRRAARHLFGLCIAGDALDERRALRVAQRLAASPRRGSLAILSAFHRLVRLDRDRHTAVVESAAPLPGDVRASVQADLERIYGRPLHTSFMVNAALIGGIRIVVGSDVYDGSVLARLAALDACW